MKIRARSERHINITAGIFATYLCFYKISVSVSIGLTISLRMSFPWICYFSGNGRCVEAFTIALNHGCGEESKAWYASTIHLQLASLDLCRACRAFATLHVQLDDDAPRSMWTPRTPPAQPTTDCKKPRRSSRIPAVRMMSAI